MKHAEPTYERDGKNIIDLTAPKDDSSRAETCKSINAAKRRSREIQLANGGLGSGFLRRAK